MFIKIKKTGITSMKSFKPFYYFLLPFVALFIFCAGICCPVEKNIAEWSVEELEDRIRGAWAGKIIGVVTGCPFEFRYCGEIYEGSIEHDMPTSSALFQDDLYVNMAFLEVLEDMGPDATMQDFAKRFRDSKFGLYHANLAARRNLLLGIEAPRSGSPPWNMHADDIDFQIEADFIGLVCPALPKSASDIAFRVGPIMNYGDGVYGGVFVANLYSQAFMLDDRVKVIKRALLSLPPESDYRKCIETVLENFEKNSKDWRACWHDVQKKWDKLDWCPGGMGSPFNIDAKINGAYVAMGILYGNMDPYKTVEISTRCGQDADCNPSTALGVISAMKGYSSLPEEWRTDIEKFRDKKFDYVRYSLDSVVKTCLDLSLSMIRKEGGTVLDKKVRVKPQEPYAPKECQQWKHDIIPYMEIPATHEKWKFKGKWQQVRSQSGPQMATLNPDTEAIIEFEGAGVMIKGCLLETGGRFDVWLDNDNPQIADTYLFPREHMPRVYTSESLWYSGRIKPGKHTLHIRRREDKNEKAGKGIIAITSIVVFK
jgi:ADP-ribosylglycohydrolase